MAEERVRIEELEEANRRLEQEVQELTALCSIGRSATSVLNLDAVLSQVVEAAVALTDAEEGLLLLPEPETGDLVLRAAKNVDKKVARELRIPLKDTLAGQVAESGEPLVVTSGRPEVAAGYQVRSLVYAPLCVPERGVVGILGVTTRRSERAFAAHEVNLLTILADYAAGAVENARLYEEAGAERRKLETVLLETEEAVIILDSELRVLLCNPAAGAALGLLTDVVGQPAREVISHRVLQELLLAAEKAERTLHAEVSVQSGRTYNAQLTPVEGVGYVLMMQDITHLKELDRIKSQFVSTISHDLRTPLTTIRGYVDLLERMGPLNDEQRTLAARVRGSITQITNLIGDLLDLGRIATGYDLEMEPLHLERIVDAVVEDFRPLAEAKRQDLRWKRQRLPLIRGNPRRLRQAVENLLSNAVTYTQEEGWIAVEAIEDDGHVVVRVADNGMGISPADQPRIFERFYRPSTAESDDTEGTGLGLAIVKSVIERHGGRIWVESQLDVGSVFTFVLHSIE